MTRMASRLDPELGVLPGRTLDDVKAVGTKLGVDPALLAPLP